MALRGCACIREAVVAREDAPGEMHLVAFVTLFESAASHHDDAPVHHAQRLTIDPPGPGRSCKAACRTPCCWPLLSSSTASLSRLTASAIARPCPLRRRRPAAAAPIAPPEGLLEAAPGRSGASCLGLSGWGVTMISFPWRPFAF